ncbi:MAG TPA: hypothetical protein VEI97_09350 [bacterium]|nr:hypothetical protein [bacterium]
MALPPKKKFKTRTSKAVQAASEREALRKMVNWTILMVCIPLLVFGIKQVNPGFFYLGQAKTYERFRQHSSAASAYERAHQANPEKNIEALLDAGRLYEYLEQYDEVARIAEAIVKEDSAATVEQRARAKFLQSRVALANERYDDALLLADEAQAGSKDKWYEYRSWIVMGIVLTRQGKHKEADEAFDTAIGIRRLFAPEAHYWRGQLYEVWNNQNQDAIEEYDYGLSQQPDPKLREKLKAAKAALLTKTAPTA